MWRDFFTEVSVNFCGNRYVEYDLLVKEMEKKLTHIDKEIRTKLFCTRSVSHCTCWLSNDALILFNNADS